MQSSQKKANSFFKIILLKVTRWVKYLLNHLYKITYDPSMKDSILELLDDNYFDQKKQINTTEKNIIRNILELEDLCVDELMTPRADIVAVDHKISLSDLKKTIKKDEHTRIPVYKDSLDKIIGFIHVKDVLSEFISKTTFSLNKIIRKILVVSPSMKALDLLAKMQISRIHIAIVLDEYGGVDGLITIENLIEAIVGEIEDEHDTTQEQDYIVLKDSSIETSARLSIKKLNELFQLSLQNEDDFETVGGLVLSLISHVPVVGEVITHETGLVFTILDADPRRIKRLHISREAN
jgi:CBS domain containing-hemolysin-like protein